MVLGEHFAGVELGWLDWGPQDAERVVVCVHGLTRNAHDFDMLAAALAQAGARVLAVDVVGRGMSSWLGDPHGYTVEVYAGQLAQWLQRLELGPVDWVGTSMGGLIGMGLAATEQPPMQRLVLNDIGPFVDRESLQQIRTYLALDLHFASIEEIEQHLRLIHAPFGPLTDAQWRHLAEYSAKLDKAGFRLHYDPAIKVPYAELADDDVVLWEMWDKIRCPTLVLHGADSVILTQPTCEEMARRGPCAEVVSFPGVGHAPALMAADQISAVRRWLHL